MVRMLHPKPGLYKGDLVKIISTEIVFFPVVGVFGNENYYMHYHDFTPLKNKIAMVLELRYAEPFTGNRYDEAFCEFLIEDKKYASEHFNPLFFDRFFKKIK